MSKKITLELTKAQMESLVCVIDEIYSSIGCSDGDRYRIRYVRNLDKMLNNNGYKRKN